MANLFQPYRLLAIIDIVSRCRPVRDDSRALLRNRFALDRAAIACLDDDGD